MHGPANSTLELVQVIFRHGARTPLKLYFELFQIRDVSEYAPFGLDALTTKGKEQEYEIGLFLRNRYGNFLGPEYIKDHVYALSTDYERTKMSLELVLAGLFPPTDYSGSKLAKLGWQPIPYSYIPKKVDMLLRPWNSEKHKKLRNEAMKSMEFLNEEAKFSSFIENLATTSGLPKITDSKMASRLYDNLIADEAMDLTMPAWYTEEVKQKLIECSELNIESLFFTEEMTKLMGGSIVKTFIDNMNLNNTDKNPRKIYLYSGHDYNLNGVLRVHGITEELKLVPVGSALILEKFRGAENKVYVRLLAWTGSGEPFALKLGKHADFCPIDEYLKLVENVLPSDSEMYKHLEDVDPKMLKDMIFADPVVKKNVRN